jgi:hypothetical protein
LIIVFAVPASSMALGDIASAALGTPEGLPGTPV